MYMNVARSTAADLVSVSGGRYLLALVTEPRIASFSGRLAVTLSVLSDPAHQ